VLPNWARNPAKGGTTPNIFSMYINKIRFDFVFGKLYIKSSEVLRLAEVLYLARSRSAFSERASPKEKTRQKSMAFFENITIGQYVPRDSLIHNLDPRTKILLVFSWVVIAAITVNLKIYLLLLSSILLVFFLSNLPSSFLFKNLKSFIWLFVLVFILQIFFTSGTLEILYHFGFMYISGQSILNGIVYSLRLAIFVLGALILSLTTSPVDLTDATFKFFSFAKKLKFPVEELSLVTMISLRFVPLLLEEAINLKKAQIARGASFDGGIFQRTKKSIPLLLPLFISSFRKADELALALDARGFRSGQERSCFQRLEFKKNDYIFLSFLIVMIFVCFWIRKM